MSNGLSGKAWIVGFFLVWAEIPDVMLANGRTNAYAGGMMDEHSDPLLIIEQWLEDARRHPEIKEPTAMALATASPQGVPSVRIVLLKEHSPAGFAFYTNMESQKSEQLAANKQASLCFYWMPLNRQVRIYGSVERLAEEKADAYFATRGRGKQLGAWASQQSRPMASPETLQERIAELDAYYGEGDIPRPPHWAGWQVIPQSIELWEEQHDRLHRRIAYTRSDEHASGWQGQWLFP